MDCRSYSSYDSLASDHRPCSAKIRLSLRSNRTKNKKTKTYEWSKLNTDGDVRTAYMVDVKNRYEQLQDLDKEEEITAEAAYHNMMLAHAKGAELNVPQRIRAKKRLPWENEDVINKRKMLNDVFKLKRMSNDLVITR